MTAGRPSLFMRNGKYYCRFCKTYDRPAAMSVSHERKRAEHLKCARKYMRRRRKGGKKN
jgi:hypothetical protein